MVSHAYIIIVRYPLRQKTLQFADIDILSFFTSGGDSIRKFKCEKSICEIVLAYINIIQNIQIILYNWLASILSLDTRTDRL